MNRFFEYAGLTFWIYLVTFGIPAAVMVKTVPKHDLELNCFFFGHMHNGALVQRVGSRR